MVRSEVDETLIGGKARNMHKSRKAKALALGKTMVMGLLERHTPGNLPLDGPHDGRTEP